jgi:hypothetical protein
MIKTQHLIWLLVLFCALFFSIHSQSNGSINGNGHGNDNGLDKHVNGNKDHVKGKEHRDTASIKPGSGGGCLVDEIFVKEIVEDIIKEENETLIQEIEEDPWQHEEYWTSGGLCFGGRILFPYGPECNDQELSKDMVRSPEINLGYNLRFMGHTFNKIWVNQHGFISFQESFYGQSLPHLDWPHPMYPYVDDPVFLTPFYAQTDLAGDKQEDVISTQYGRVLYKVIIRKSLPLTYTEEEKFVYQLTMKLLDDTQVLVQIILIY